MVKGLSTVFVFNLGTLFINDIEIAKTPSFGRKSKAVGSLEGFHHPRYVRHCSALLSCYNAVKMAVRRARAQLRVAAVSRARSQALLVCSSEGNHVTAAFFMLLHQHIAIVVLKYLENLT